MTIREDKVRDYLSSNLAVIEDGLQLIKPEYHMPSKPPASGGRTASGGRIDILARDRFGMLVVIEVKVAEGTAREAAGELVKYAVLLHATAGFGPSSVRFIVASTVWHELETIMKMLTAMFEALGYALEGKMLSVSDDYLAITARPWVQSSQFASYINRNHRMYSSTIIFSFTEEADVESFVKKCSDILIESFREASFGIIRMERESSHISTMYRFGALLFMDVIDECDVINPEVDPELMSDEDSSEAFGVLGELIAESGVESMGNNPESLAHHLVEYEWRHNGYLARRGRYESPVFDIETVMEMALALSSNRGEHFLVTVEPARTSRWSEITTALRQFLHAHGVCWDSISRYLTDCRASQVTIQAYCPFSILDIIASGGVEERSFIEVPHFLLLMKLEQATEIVCGQLYPSESRPDWVQAARIIREPFFSGVSPEKEMGILGLGWRFFHFTSIDDGLVQRGLMNEGLVSYAFNNHEFCQRICALRDSIQIRMRR